ncbi:D-alanyl-D-alanine carboxypeptidase (penicillin-binding protein 5/6) [Kineosphaera limosa]|uniref:D-alanyl-D-alanine carboxypeptidase n=1 Tax=Kineosphaera limosa NBRC 100340 TaxID=1184609 RepID=K6WSB9_9MICO|nr:serine hydrolase [Kineosphaera limosa]NYE01843.1 D-alanyl-D-alanine carboxypeptidase (penicillin-binding protein 5/6) [Kineosphaera limosa]GAB96746.1 D-alanyl-D-alanine carboxypeptidase [Kineosphaera limosa NBRC 100340]
MATATVLCAGLAAPALAAPGLAHPDPPTFVSAAAAGNPTADLATEGLLAGPNPAPSPGITEPVGPGRRGGPQLDQTGVIIYDRPAGVPRPPDFAAGAYLLANLDTGDVLLAHNAHVQSLPASTIKTLTALALQPVLDPNQVVKATAEDAAVDGTKVGMDPGASYTVDQLLHALMMSSANDAAVALARAAGGLDVATGRMNEVLQQIGAVDSHAANTSGLDAVGQVTTAYDLALIGRAAVNNEAVQRYATQRTFDFPAGLTKKGHPERGQYQISNHNKLLWNYEGTIGVKNGYTIKARQTYIGAVRRGDQAYLVTYLAGNGGGWRATADLLDWAFEYGPKLKPIGTLNQPEAPAATADAEHAAAAVAIDPQALGGDDSGGLTKPLVIIGVVLTALGATVVALRIRAVRRIRARRARMAG